MQQDDDRVRRIKRYVLTRLRAELADAPRGAQAKLAKRLDVSGAHLSNMLSVTPSRQPGEGFRRKVAHYWGVSYAQLEALALGEAPPASPSKSISARHNAMPPNFAKAVSEHAWMHELPLGLRAIVREQARLHYVYGPDHVDLPSLEWRAILTELERAALALVATRAARETKRTPTPRRRRPSGSPPTVR